MVLALLPHGAMASDVTVVVADPGNMAAIRETASLPGRVMLFPSASLGSAMESIRAYRPKVVAVDAMVAQTPSGAVFVDRVEQLAIAGSRTLLLVEHDGRWMTTPRDGAGARGVNHSRTGVSASQPHLSAPSKPVVAAASAAVAPAVQAELASTRRVPRFLVRDSLDVVIESGCAHLVDLSVLGAQLVSLPVLRPGQKIKVSLPDTGDMLNVVAQVAWSLFEKPQRQAEPHYRVGLEFTDAAQVALEQYRRRHCGDQPTPFRGR